MLNNFEDLYLNCKFNLYKNVEKNLASNNVINIIQEDGSCFKSAAKNNNTKLLNLLISYYKNHIKFKVGSNEYNSDMFKLQEVLENCYNHYRFDMSDEMKKLLIDNGARIHDFDSFGSLDSIEEFLIRDDDEEFENYTDSSFDAKLNSSDEDYSSDVNKEEDPAAAFYADLAADLANSNSNSDSSNHSNHISVNIDTSQSNFSTNDDSILIGDTT